MFLTESRLPRHGTLQCEELLAGARAKGDAVSACGGLQRPERTDIPSLVALKHDPRVSLFGIRLRATGLAPKAVITVYMHKPVLLIYGILKSGMPFDPRFGVRHLDFQDGI